MLDQRYASLVIAAGMVIGLVGGGAVLGRSIQETRAGDRYVTVRGLSEKEVTADLAIWPIRVRVAGDDLGAVSKSAQTARDKVVAFLNDNGIGRKDVVIQSVRVQDRQANDFAPLKNALRYVVEHTVVLRSTDVGKVREISQMTDRLVAAGVVLSSQGI
jgi:hypothetical protein